MFFFLMLGEGNPQGTGGAIFHQAISISGNIGAQGVQSQIYPFECVGGANGPAPPHIRP